MIDKINIFQSIQLDKKGWNISLDQLYFPENLHFFKNTSTELIEREDSKYSCLFYLVSEYRMLSYTGLICIYKDKTNPQIIFNSEHWFDYNFRNSLNYCDKYLILRKNEMYFEKQKKVFSPFVIIDLENNSFAIIDFDFTSIYYSVEYAEVDKIVFRINNPEDFNSLRVPVKNRDGQILDLSTYSFHPFSEFDDELKKYCDDKKRL